jgi:hypothetical protein
MRMKLLADGGRGAAFCISLALGLGVGGAALAHHSFAMYDNEHQVKMTGAVKVFQWTNPHVYIGLETLENGVAKEWTIECANPGILNRVGWKFNMIKPGDKLTLVMAPMRSGEAAGLLKEVTLPDGRVFGNGAPAGPALVH